MILIYTKRLRSQKLNIYTYDYQLMDACQDFQFTAFLLHAVIESLENKSKWISIISDNSSHYYNADLIIILSHQLEWYQINIKKQIFLKAEKAKTAIDNHHAYILNKK